METKNILYLLLLMMVIFVMGSVLNSTLDKDHWGTVADWSMISITIITAYYLYQTLQSQQKVQKDQEKINKLNTLHIRKSFKPSISVASIQLYQNNTKYRVVLNILDNPIHNISLKSNEYYIIDSHHIPRLENSEFQYNIPRLVNNELPISLSEITCNFETWTDIDNIINEFNIDFEDEFGLKYSKTILIEYNSQTYRFTSRLSNDDFL